MTAPGEPALAGLRVVDLSAGIAGADCTKLLVDAGAGPESVLLNGNDFSNRRTIAGLII